MLLSGCTGAAPSSSGDDAGEVGGPAAITPFAQGAVIGDTRLFTRIGEPGFPEGIVVGEERVLVSSVERGGPGVIFEHDLGTGRLLRNTTLASPPQQTGAFPDGALGLALDAAGRMYATQIMGARILRIDVDGEQQVYAEIPDIPSCISAAAPCSPTATDRAPLPNYPAFTADGTMYVSDTFQATIFRIPPAGQAEPWFQDARLDGFGPNGIAVSPDDAFLYIAQTALAFTEMPQPLGAAAIPAGAVWRVPLMDAPNPADLELVHQYEQGFVDGIAFGASGRLYATLIDPDVTDAAGADGISVLSPDGTEAFFPSPGQNPVLDVPYDRPASIAFHDAHRSILVTNLANSPATPGHWAVLEAFVDDTAHPLHRPEVP